MFGHWRGLNLWISHREDSYTVRNHTNRVGVNKKGSDVKKELNPEPLNRSLYDKINERYKGVWVLWPT